MFCEQLSSILHRLPISDLTISDELAERNLLRRRHEASRVRIAQLAFHAWIVRFLAGIWSAWRLATNRSQLKGVSKSVKKFAKAVRKGRVLVHSFRIPDELLQGVHASPLLRAKKYLADRSVSLLVSREPSCLNSRCSS